MGKTTTYILMLSGMFLLCHMAGIIGANDGSIIWQLVFNIQNITSSALYQNIAGGGALVSIGIAAVIGAAGIIAVFASRILQFDLIATAPLCLYLLTLGQDMLALMDKIAQYSNIWLALLITPMILLFPLVIMSYWRGHD